MKKINKALGDLQQDPETCPSRGVQPFPLSHTLVLLDFQAYFPRWSSKLSLASGPFPVWGI